MLKICCCTEDSVPHSTDTKYNSSAWKPRGLQETNSSDERYLHPEVFCWMRAFWNNFFSHALHLKNHKQSWEGQEIKPEGNTQGIQDSRHKVSAATVLCSHANLWVYKTGFLIILYELTVDYVIQAKHKRVMKRTRYKLVSKEFFMAFVRRTAPHTLLCSCHYPHIKMQY